MNGTGNVVANERPAAFASDAELAQLAEEIRQHHKSVERHARAMLFEAIVAGGKLSQAKARLRHGEYEPFVAYCALNERTARLYRQLAREAKSGNVAVLQAESIRAALKALAHPPEPRPKPPDLGPPCKPSYAHSWLWQWGEWQKATGRDLPTGGLWGMS